MSKIIDWIGDEFLPVHPDDTVNIFTRNGNYYENEKAGDWGWCWFDSPFDVVQYQIVKRQKDQK